MSSASPDFAAAPGQEQPGSPVPWLQHGPDPSQEAKSLGPGAVLEPWDHSGPGPPALNSGFPWAGF